MTRRSNPYPPTGFNLYLPHSTWTSALAELRSYGDRGESSWGAGSEGLVYLGGVAESDSIIVTTIYVPAHEPQGDQVRVTRQEARWLMRALRDRDEKLVAQIHSHRGPAHHSMGDDEHAASFHAGFISIVAPAFASGVERVDECAVFEFRSGRFIELDANTVKARIQLTGEVVSRAPSQPQVANPSREKPWSRFAQKLKSIARAKQ